MESIERKYVITTGTKSFIVLAFDSCEAVALVSNYMYKKFDGIVLFKSNKKSKIDECIGLIPGVRPLKSTEVKE